MGWETDNWKTPDLSDLSRSNYMGPRPNPSPHMSGHVPPATPWVAPTRDSWRPIAARPTTPSKNARSVAATEPPAVPKTLSQRAATFALWGAALAGLYAWLGVHATVMSAVGYAVAGAILGAIAAVAVAIVVKLVEVALKVLVLCLKIGLPLALLYILLRSLGHTV